MSVPGVAMDHVCIHPHRIEVCATADRAEYRIKVLRTMENRGIHTKTAHCKIFLVDFLIPETSHLDLHYLCQFTTQIITVNTGAPINVRGVFVRQKEGLHSGI